MEYVPRTEYGLISPAAEPDRRRHRRARRRRPHGPVRSGRPGDRAGSGRWPLQPGGRRTGSPSGCTTASPAARCRAYGPRTSWSMRLEDTVAGWRSWSDIHQSYTGPWRELVHASGRVLQALTFYPTGAIVAAPTTSLPETPGGSRNWDYRYSWVRDASLTMDALWVAACPDEAAKFFGYLSTAAATSLGRGADLQIMFGVGGERDLSERVLPHLDGWRGSVPVRVGNGAWTPAAGRRLRRAAGGRQPAAGPDRRARPGDPGVPRRRRRRGRAPVDRERPGHLGDPRRPAGLPLLEGHVLGRARPRHRAGRDCSAPRTGWTAGSARRTTSTRPCSGTAGAIRRAPSRSTSAPTTSTPPA